MKSISLWLVGAALGMAAVGASAQQPAVPPQAPAKSTPQIDAGEPRVDTSTTPVQAPAPAEAPVKPAAAGTRSAAAAHSGAERAAPAGRSARGANDRLDLGLTTVTGDKEQPKVMYIVPWKKSDIGDLSGKPMNSLLDEALAPVDRDEFRREVAYYGAMTAPTPPNGANAPKAAQGEK